MPTSPAERRLNQQLWKYWDQLRRDRLFPSEDDLDPTSIIQLWPECFLLQVRDMKATQDFNYSYFGPVLNQAYQNGKIPGMLPGIVAPEAKHLASLFAQVAETHAPLVTEGHHRISDGKLLKYRQILLPLGNSAERVEAILGRMGFIICNV